MRRHRSYLTLGFVSLLAGATAACSGAATDEGESDSSLSASRLATSTVLLKSLNGDYVTAVGGGGANVTADQTTASTDQILKLVDLSHATLESGDSIELQVHNGDYVGALCGGGKGERNGVSCGDVEANRAVAGTWETFTIGKKAGSAGSAILDGDSITLKSSGGYFCTAEGGGGAGSIMTCNRSVASTWETFTLSISSSTANPDMGTAGDKPDLSTSKDNPDLSTPSAPSAPPSAPTLPSSTIGKVYYVSPTGSDSNAGTSASPFKTISHAAGITNPGDTVNVMSGTYTNPCTGCDVVDITRSGSSAAGGYITYQAAPGQHPLIQFTGSWMAFNIQASYIVVSGFEIEGLDQASLTAAEAASLGEGSPKTNQAGIVGGTASLVTPWSHIFISGNTVHGCSEAGIDVMRSDYVTIQNNITYDNSNWSPYGGSGISLGYLADSDTNTGYKNFVINNISYDNQMLVGEPAAGGTMADGNGIIIDDNENDQNGHAAYNGRTLVQNNLCYMNGGTGIHTFHSQHVDIVYNTAYMNNQSADNSNGQISGIEVADVKIYNNVLYGVGTKPVTSNSGTFTFDYNVLFNGTVTTTSAHDVVADPKFVTPGSNFQLLAGSPAVDSASTTFVVATDLLGKPRPVGAGYDRGCYELQTP